VTALQDILIGPLCLYTMFVTWLVTIFLPHNNNKININNSKTFFMVLSLWQSHCDSSPGLFDECRRVPSGRRPKTKLYDLGCEFACTGCQSLHQPSPFIIITQPESWYSFYCSTEGRRPSRPSWLVTYRDDTRPQTVTQAGTIQVWRSAFTLIEANVLPLSQTAKPYAMHKGGLCHRVVSVCLAVCHIRVLYQNE